MKLNVFDRAVATGTSKISVIKEQLVLKKLSVCHQY